MAAEAAHPEASKLTHEAILSAAKHRHPPGRNESTTKFLGKQTHLHLNGRRISTIDALIACPLLKVLYLFDNEIEVLDLGAGGSQITHLYLQHNQICRVGPSLTQLRCLNKLYLDNNCLGSLAPLAPLAPTLVELHVSSQRPADGSSLDLAPQTLELMLSLRVLACASNRVTSVAPLAGLRSLETVDLSKNELASLQSIAPLLTAAPLRELDLRGNSLSDSRQTTDSIIVAAKGIHMLNGRKLTKSERPYLEQLHMRGARQFNLEGGAQG